MNGFSPLRKIQLVQSWFMVWVKKQVQFVIPHHLCRLLRVEGAEFFLCSFSIMFARILSRLSLSFLPAARRISRMV